ncbi:hypothetical protein RSX31_17165 [Rossellomorea sp. YC4-1]|nr:hypothetical protein [Rossellomorea sp. YC4-1]
MDGFEILEECICARILKRVRHLILIVMFRGVKGFVALLAS